MNTFLCLYRCMYDQFYVRIRICSRSHTYTHFTTSWLGLSKCVESYIFHAHINPYHMYLCIRNCIYVHVQFFVYITIKLFGHAPWNLHGYKCIHISMRVYTAGCINQTVAYIIIDYFFSLILLHCRVPAKGLPFAPLALLCRGVYGSFHPTV